MRYTLPCILLLLLFVSTAPAQENFSVSGYIKDKQTGEDIAFVNVVEENQHTHVVSNAYGYFSVSVPQGKIDLKFDLPGYNSNLISLDLSKDTVLNISLTPLGTTTDTVRIFADENHFDPHSSSLNRLKLSVADIKKLPVIFGETDIIKSLQLMPGVQPSTEGMVGINVRGGSPDQNLVLLDEAIVYNPSHVLGFFSVVNPDAIRDDVQMYKGGIPANYGGRISSVTDVRMKEGNSQKFHGSGGMGFVSSRLMLEGPLIKDVSSFMISGRRTWIDLLLLASSDPRIKESTISFYDLNAKINCRVKNKNRFFVSGYFGNDVYARAGYFRNKWGNGTGTFRWNHLINDKIFTNTTLVFSNFNYGFDYKFGTELLGYKASIRDYTLKTDLTCFASSKITGKAGVSTTFRRFIPGKFVPESESAFLPENPQPDLTFEHAVYVSAEHRISTRLHADCGLRYSFFQQIGPDTVVDFSHSPIDTLAYSSGKNICFYHGAEPRVAFSFALDEKQSLRLSYNRLRQYILLASNSTASYPWDIWLHSSDYLKPQIADQITLGYSRSISSNKYEFSADAFYKLLSNQVDFRDGAMLLRNPSIEGELLAGKGWAYGSELLLRKNEGRFHGWIGYTLSWSKRQIDGINGDDVYYARNDRRHQINIATIYKASKKTELSVTWLFMSGNPTTFPSGRVELNGFIVPIYGDRNQDRMPAYHRLDLNCTFDVDKRADKKMDNKIVVGLYNAYGRKNPFTFKFTEKEGAPTQTVAVATYIFRWIPSFTWNFSF